MDRSRGVKATALVLILIAAGAATISACGDDDDDAASTVEGTATVGTTTESDTVTSGVEETTPGGAVVPAAPDCAQGQIYSQGKGACVAERPGSNPCPPGEIPAADQPTCLPKD